MDPRLTRSGCPQCGTQRIINAITTTTGIGIRCSTCGHTDLLPNIKESLNNTKQKLEGFDQEHAINSLQSSVESIINHFTK